MAWNTVRSLRGEPLLVLDHWSGKGHVGTSAIPRSEIEGGWKIRVSNTLGNEVCFEV